jgi:hypothetical protein
MRAYERVEVWRHLFLTLALDEHYLLALRPGCFIPGERTPGIHRIERCFGLQNLSGRFGEEIRAWVQPPRNLVT